MASIWGREWLFPVLELGVLEEMVYSSGLLGFKKFLSYSLQDRQCHMPHFCHHQVPAVGGPGGHSEAQETSHWIPASQDSSREQQGGPETLAHQ